jgi:hypothetical protein
MKYIFWSVLVGTVLLIGVLAISGLVTGVTTEVLLRKIELELWAILWILMWWAFRSWRW